MQPKTIRISQKQALLCVGALLLCAALVRLMLAYSTVHFYDVNYYFDWSLGAARDFSGVYNHVENIDYPPLFLFFLYFTGKFLQSPAVQAFAPYVMILLKGWQIFFDLAVGALLYLLFRRRGEMAGVLICAFWLANPATLLNSSYWGQTDSIMLFFLLGSFALLIAQMPILAAVVMTLASLMKFQSLYYAPLFALALVSAFPMKKVLRAVAAGLGTGLAVFLPFLLRSGWDLPVRVYLGGFESYPAASLNAFNFFTLIGLNRRPSQTKLLGLFSCEVFSWCAIALMLLLLVYFYFTATEQSIWLLALFGIQTIFLFTTRMHERYQLPALLFCLAAAFTHKSAGLFGCYLGLTAVSFLNQFLVMEEALLGGRREAWVGHFDLIMQVGSWINLLLYLLLVFLTVRIFYRKGRLTLRQALRSLNG